jgi:hypothetical protein
MCLLCTDAKFFLNFWIASTVLILLLFVLGKASGESWKARRVSPCRQISRSILQGSNGSAWAPRWPLTRCWSGKGSGWPWLSPRASRHGAASLNTGIIRHFLKIVSHEISTDPDPIRGYVPLANRSGSCYFRPRPSRRQQKTIFYAYYLLKVHLHPFSKIKVIKKIPT